MYHYQYNKVLILLNKKKILHLDFNISLVYLLIKIQQRSKEKKEQKKSTAETCIKHNILFLFVIKLSLISVLCFVCVMFRHVKLDNCI